MSDGALVLLKEKTLAEIFELTPVGLIIRGSPDYTAWAMLGDKLGYAHSAVHFWIGDWLKYGERAYGEMYSQALNETILEYQTLRNDKWVAERIELSRRRDNLSWSHHAEVASLSPDEQDYWLDRAESEGLTRRELRAEIRASKILPPSELPAGMFPVVYADPPWQYDNTGFDQSAASHYSTMPVEDICSLKIPTADDAVLFLWATSPLLPEALRVMDAWGFEYKASFVWVKDRAPGIGWFVNTKHELLLIGVRGDGMHPRIKLDSVFEAAVRKHSQKPDVCYEMIERMYGGPYLELFARRKRDGWEAWGNEV